MRRRQARRVTVRGIGGMGLTPGDSLPRRRLVADTPRGDEIHAEHQHRQRHDPGEIATGPEQKASHGILREMRRTFAFSICSGDSARLSRGAANLQAFVLFRLVRCGSHDPAARSTVGLMSFAARFTSMINRRRDLRSGSRRRQETRTERVTSAEVWLPIEPYSFEYW